MADDSELDRLDPVPVTCELSTGLAVEVVRMRTRQFFRLLRVLTHGAGPAMMQSGLDFKADSEEFASKLLMLVVMSIPDAEQEAVLFLQSMCRPAGIADKPAAQLTKQETEDNQALWARFAADLHNPELDDTLDLIEAIVRNEAPELQALGKKLERVTGLFRKTGQDKEPPEPELTPEEAELAGAFAAAFDTLSHEYGWTDEYILGLPLCRVRQALEAAGARRQREQLAHMRLMEWQVKTVCTFIGAQAWVDVKQHGGRNPLVDMARDISITGEKSPEELELERIRGPRVADRLEDDPRFGKVAADPAAGVEAENAAGSYESFMSMMAGPPPVPGRG